MNELASFGINALNITRKLNGLRHRRERPDNHRPDCGSLTPTSQFLPSSAVSSTLGITQDVLAYPALSTLG